MSTNTCDPRVKNAIDIATFWHDVDARKGEFGGTKIPYIIHPMRVMELVWKWGAGTVENLVAAVCHDLLEDTGITFQQLSSSIGDESAGIVVELTHQEQSGSAKDRQIAKVNYMASFSTRSVNALVIKLADRVCNVLDFAMTDLAYARIYFNKASALFDAFVQRSSEVADKFGQVVVDKINASLQALQGMLFGLPLNPIFSV